MQERLPCQGLCWIVMKNQQPSLWRKQRMSLSLMKQPWPNKTGQLKRKYLLICNDTRFKTFFLKFCLFCKIHVIQISLKNGRIFICSFFFFHFRYTSAGTTSCTYSPPHDENWPPAASSTPFANVEYSILTIFRYFNWSDYCKENNKIFSLSHTHINK